MDGNSRRREGKTHKAKQRQTKQIIFSPNNLQCRDKTEKGRGRQTKKWTGRWHNSARKTRQEAKDKTMQQLETKSETKTIVSIVLIPFIVLVLTLSLFWSGLLMSSPFPTCPCCSWIQKMKTRHHLIVPRFLRSYLSIYNSSTSPSSWRTLSLTLSGQKSFDLFLASTSPSPCLSLLGSSRL